MQKPLRQASFALDTLSSLCFKARRGQGVHLHITDLCFQTLDPFHSGNQTKLDTCTTIKNGKLDYLLGSLRRIPYIVFVRIEPCTPLHTLIAPLPSEGCY